MHWAFRVTVAILCSLWITSCGLRSKKNNPTPQTPESIFIRQDTTPNSADGIIRPGGGGRTGDKDGALKTDTIKAPTKSGETELSVPDVPEGNPFTCQEEQQTTSTTPLLRLTRREYRHTIEDLFGEYITDSAFNSLLQSIPSDNRTGIFHNQDLSVSLPTIQGYLSVATQIADILSQDNTFMGEHFPCETINENCIRAFASSIGENIIRRPWTEQDFATYMNLTESVDSSDRTVVAQVLLASLLQSPNMIYKVELGDSEIDSGVYTLTDWEIANRIAYAATGHPPPRDTWSLIKDEDFQDPIIMKAWLKDLIQRNQTQEHSRLFYSEWLSFDQLPSPGYSNTFLAGINSMNIAVDAQAELHNLTQDLTWKSKGTYKDLFLTDKSYSSSETLQNIYQSVSGNNSTSSTTISLNMFEFSDNEPEDVMGQIQWTPYGNEARAQFSINIQNQDTVSVTAYGQPLNDVYPVMTVRILDSNQNEINTQNIDINSMTPRPYTMNTNGAVGTITVILGTNNDEVMNNEDRNLWVIQAQKTSVTSSEDVVAKDPTARHGLLSRIGFLLSGDDSTHLVHRGVKIRQRILCESMNPPSVDPDNPDQFDPPAPDPEKSTRDQIAERTAAPQCAACHTRINPMGFIFEHFDAIGRYRDFEKIFSPNGQLLAEHPVNATVEPYIRGPGESAVSTANDMSAAIAKSNKGAACLTLQWFAYTRQRPATQNDMCEMKTFYDQLQTKDTTSYSGETPATILNMLHSSFLTGAFHTLVKAQED